MDERERLQAKEKLMRLCGIIEDIESALEKKLASTPEPDFLSSPFIIQALEASKGISIMRLSVIEANVCTNGAFSALAEHHNVLEDIAEKILEVEEEIERGATPSEAMDAVLGSPPAEST